MQIQAWLVSNQKELHKIRGWKQGGIQQVLPIREFLTGYNPSNPAFVPTLLPFSQAESMLKDSPGFWKAVEQAVPKQAEHPPFFPRSNGTGPGFK
jgi:hypothetical protein